MSKTVYYIVYFDFENSNFLGIRKKILNQITALKMLEYKVILIFPQNRKLILIDHNDIRNVHRAKKGFTNYRMSIYKFIKSNIFKTNHSIFIFRFPGSFDYILIKTFSLLNNKHSVLLEMPTFPVIHEMLAHLVLLVKKIKLAKAMRYLFVLLSHATFSVFLYRKIHKIITFTNDDYIYKTPTIIIDNGVNTETCLPIYSDFHSDVIRFTVVANANIWHGIDRIISGLKNYYMNDQEHKIFINIVGESPYTEELKKITENDNTNLLIKYYGNLAGNELELIYKNTDIAFSSLGMHRINLEYGSPLKTKEYMSYGIPFVYSYKEKLLSEDFPFALRVPANDEPIDFVNVIHFYKKVKEINNYKTIMHDFARKNYDWKVQMKKVLDSINEI